MQGQEGYRKKSFPSLLSLSPFSIFSSSLTLISLPLKGEEHLVFIDVKQEYEGL